ncbi:MAG: succinylglutamate desuccinylase/aspartoacylase family protein [Roseibacillus sp.]
MFRFQITALFLTVLPLSAQAEASSVAGVLAGGTEWETPYYLINSGQPGPTVLITGGVHGDEPAGARAAEQIRHWRIGKGRLVVVPRVNVPALTAGTRHMPGVEKPLLNLNRNFPRATGPNEARGELARALWSLVEKIEPDWVLDLHEGFHFHQVNDASVGSTIIDANREEADEIIPRMLKSINATISDQKKKFVRLRGSANGSLSRAANAHLGAAAMTLETTRREQPLSFRTRQHRIMVHTLLDHLGMIEAGTPNLVTPSRGKSLLRVALYDAGGVGGNGPRQLETVIKEIKPSFTWRISSGDIADGALQQFDLVIFPGGSGSKQAAAIGAEGRAHVRNFVEDGGGFVGVCAGAYLAAANYKWSLAISNHKTFCEVREIPKVGRKSMWYRGKSSTVKMALTKAGKEILGQIEGTIPVRYHNGPIVSPANHEGLPGYQVLAHFRSEVARYETQKGTMVDTPAIIASNFGKGRVLCISPHPESSKELRPLVARGIQWTARSGKN